MCDGKANVFVQVKHGYFAPVNTGFSKQLIQCFKLTGARG